MLKPHLRKKKNTKNCGWLRNPQLETVVSTSPIFSHFFIGFQPRWCGISQSPSATSPAPTRRRSLSSRRGRVAWAPAVSAMFGVGVNHVIGWLSCYWSWGYQYIYIQSVYIIIIIYIIYTPNGSWMFLVVFQCCFSRCCSGKPDLQMVNSTSTGAG